MIRANITEIKNRFSHYIRLVQGGEEIEILDRKTPLARIVSITGLPDGGKDASWVKRLTDHGIIKPPDTKKTGSDFTNQKGVVTSKSSAGGVLDALLEERDNGR